MEKNNVQLELFSKGGESGSQMGSASSPFFKKLWKFEKIILLVLCVLITAVVSFSFGFEKGKRFASNNSNLRLDTAKLTEKNDAINLAIVNKQIAPSVVGKNVEPILVKQAVNQGLFTIQLASYKSRLSAQKEAEALKKKGFTALIFPKGGYTVLCVGRYNTKESAQAYLAELNKKYKGCFIRRI